MTGTKRCNLNAALGGFAPTPPTSGPVQWPASDTTEHDPVNHPRHYTSHPSGVECIAVVEHFNFNRGNAIKYIWRAGEKGDEIEDLQKSVWYLRREIERLERLLRGAP